jgi:hypothetical protein
MIGGTDNVTGTTSVTGGTVNFQGGTAITLSTLTLQAGTVTVQSGKLSLSGDYTQTGGSTIVGANTTLTSEGTVNILGGMFSGAGIVNGNVNNAGTFFGTLQIYGNVVNSGTLNPGGTGAGGILTINGTYTQTATGILTIEIGGTSPGIDYDQLVVKGTASLGGTLNVVLISPFSPPPGSQYQILTFAKSGSTTFDTTNIAPGFVLPIYNPTDVTLLAN